MKKVRTELIGGLTIGILAALLVVACAPQVFAQPTAANLAVADTSGNPGTYVIVPVNISTVQDGPIICIVYDLQYTSSVIEIVGIQNGNLTSSWDSQYNAFTWGARISLVYDGQTAHGLQNGSTGSIALLNLSVLGDPGETSLMQLTNIQLSDTAYNVGTASADNGLFSIPGSPPTPTPTPTPSPSDPPAEGGGGGEGAPLDTDGDGYPDQLEWLEGTDPNDPNDYPGTTEARSLPRFPAILSSFGASSTASPSITASTTSFTGGPAQARAPTPLGLKALIAIAGLVAVACMLMRSKGLL